MLRSLLLPNPHLTPIALAAICIWLATFLWPEIWIGAAAWGVRAACLALWTWAVGAVFFRQGDWLTFASPQFVLVTSALWLYAIIPVGVAMLIFTTDWAWLAGIIVSQTYPGLIERIIGSEGELAILRFSLVGIAGLAWVVPVGSSVRKLSEHPADLPSRRIVLGVGVGAALVYCLQRYVGFDKLQGVWAEMSGHATFSALLLYLLAAALATVRAIMGIKGARVDLAMLWIGAIGPALFGGLKSVVFFFVVAGLVVALSRRSGTAVAGVVALSLGLLVLGVATKQFPSASFKEKLGYAGMILGAKTVVRQAETVDCLTGAMRARLSAGGEQSSSLYFMAGLVPRVLWPDKPNLSISGKTIISYCHPSAEPNLRTDHSASGTLLWEPVAFAGISGQITAQTLTFAILIVLSRLWLNGGPYAAAGVLALTPWTIDFDQHFALYIANLTKAGLVISVSLFLLAWAGRILRRQ